MLEGKVERSVCFPHGQSHGAVQQQETLQS